MTTRVETVRPDDPIAVARELFRRRQIRHAPVVVLGRVVGMLSDRDVRAAAADIATSIDAIMSPPSATTTPSTPIEEAAAMMRSRKMGALPVLEGEDLVGIISESDLLGALIELCAAMDPAIVLGLECDEDANAPHRVRQLVEKHGGTVAWMTAIRARGGRQQISVRLRMPRSRTPSEMFEEAGFTVTSCIVGPTAARH